MTIRLEREGESLFARYENDSGQTITVDVSVYLALGAGGDRILRSLCAYIDRVRTRSAINYLRIAVVIGRSLIRAGAQYLPTSERGWQELAVSMYREILTNPSSKASLETRANDTYPTARTLLLHLQRDGVIPLSTIFPNAPKKELVVALLNPTAQLLGDKEPVPVEKFDSKLLCDILLSRTDAEYLDEIQDLLLYRKQRLKDGLLSYWQAMKSHIEWGAKALAETDAEALIAEYVAHKSFPASTSISGKRYHFHYLSPASPDGLARLLAIFKHTVGGLPSHRELRASPYLPRIVPYADRWCYPPGVHRLNGSRKLDWSTRARWFLGRLSLNDIAVLAALLIMEHSRFTPEAITQARITNKHGQKAIVIEDYGKVLVLPKHRAHQPKRAFLSPLSIEIVDLVSDLASDVRNELKKKQSPLSDLLFIPFDPLGKKPIAPNHGNIVTFLSGGASMRGIRKKWVGDYVGGLEEVGLTRGTITFTKIRHTEGVLEWFRTGSIGAMARKLGNKSRTAIDHYLPEALLAAWNTRLIRRFQNLWITVAAFDEDYLLEATDFHTVNELQNFLTQMLQQHPSDSSPLSLELHVRVAKANGQDSESLLEGGRASLCVNISKNSLAALYILSDSVFTARVESKTLDKRDPASGISLRMFVDLATLLKHRLPHHEMAEYRDIHVEAQRLAAHFSSRLNWSNLLVSKDHEPI